MGDSLTRKPRPVGNGTGCPRRCKSVIYASTPSRDKTAKLSAGKHFPLHDYGSKREVQRETGPTCRLQIHGKVSWRRRVTTSVPKSRSIWTSSEFIRDVFETVSSTRFLFQSNSYQRVRTAYGPSNSAGCYNCDCTCPHQGPRGKVIQSRREDQVRYEPSSHSTV